MSFAQNVSSTTDDKGTLCSLSLETHCALYPSHSECNSGHWPNKGVLAHFSTNLIRHGTFPVHACISLTNTGSDYHNISELYFSGACAFVCTAW